jgi:hypothetical protein
VHWHIEMDVQEPEKKTETLGRSLRPHRFHSCGYRGFCELLCFPNERDARGRVAELLMLLIGEPGGLPPRFRVVPCDPETFFT